MQLKKNMLFNHVMEQTTVLRVLSTIVSKTSETLEISNVFLPLSFL